ncbi:MAG TPA: hypothetical protein VIE43_25670 [Thermoanaerobaculia bacterium]|nr:hypothetical protein [Thermoanaerobaculia bacterium]
MHQQKTGSWAIRSMTAGLLAAILFSNALLPRASASSYQKPLTNDDIEAMTRAGLPEEVVIAKIKASQAAFDISPAALIALEKAKISGDIIRSMVNAMAEAKPAAQVSSMSGTTPVACQVPLGGQPPWLSDTSPAMWYSDLNKGEPIEMNYEHGTIQHVGYGPFQTILLVLHPERSNLRVSGGAQFLSCINPTDAPLVHFSLDKGERNTSVGKITPWGGPVRRISPGDLVPFKFDKTSDGYFRITPSSPLPPGEYGFVPQASVGFFSEGERVYTFGVD